MINIISQSLGLDVVNINAYAKFYQNIPNGLELSTFFTNRSVTKSSQTVRWQNNQIFDYRALYESQPSVSVDFLRVVQFIEEINVKTCITELDACLGSKVSEVEKFRFLQTHKPATVSFKANFRASSTSPLNRDLRPFGAHLHSLTEKWISRTKLNFRHELNYGLSERLQNEVYGFLNHNFSEKMYDFACDLDYLNDIRDAQMFQRAPRRKFERLDPFEYYDDA